MNIITDLDIAKTYTCYNDANDVVNGWRKFQRARSEGRTPYIQIAKEFGLTKSCVYSWISGVTPVVITCLNWVIEKGILRDTTPEEDLEKKVFALTSNMHMFKPIREMSLFLLLSGNMKAGFIYSSNERALTELQSYFKEQTGMETKIADVWKNTLEFEGGAYISRVAQALTGVSGKKVLNLREWPSYLKIDSRFRREFLQILYRTKGHFSNLKDGSVHKRLNITLPLVEKEATANHLSDDIIDMSIELTGVEFTKSIYQADNNRWSAILYTRGKHTALDFFEALFLKV